MLFTPERRANRINVKIHPEQDDLNILLDVERASSAADVVDKRDAACAKAVVVIFELERPII